MQIRCIVGIFILLMCANYGVRAEDDTIYIGLNAEFGHVTSTSDDAIKEGILSAIDEINSSGGVLGGKKLALITRDNRSIPARALEYYKELGAIPGLAAVFCGKFGSAVLESLSVIHQMKLPLLDPWAANDIIIDNGYTPNYTFRLSLKDGWAIPVMMDHARSRGIHKIGALLVNTSWGRNNLKLLEKYVKENPDMRLTTVEWFNFGEKTMLDKHNRILRSGAEAILLVAVEVESAVMVRDMASLPKQQRLPVISHWSITGSDFPALTGPALEKIDITFVQTFLLSENTRALNVLKKRGLAGLKSPGGFAHAYDLTHILARAIHIAGSTNREKIRDALEKVKDYDGMIMFYKQPFTETNHEALSSANVFMAVYDKNGVIRKKQ